MNKPPIDSFGGNTKEFLYDTWYEGGDFKDNDVLDALKTTNKKPDMEGFFKATNENSDIKRFFKTNTIPKKIYEFKKANMTNEMEIEIEIPSDYTDIEKKMIKEKVNNCIDRIFEEDKEMSEIISEEVEDMLYAAGIVRNMLIEVRNENRNIFEGVWE